MAAAAPGDHDHARRMGVEAGVIEEHPDGRSSRISPAFERMFKDGMLRGETPVHALASAVRRFMPGSVQKERTLVMTLVVAMIEMQEKGLYDAIMAEVGAAAARASGGGPGAAGRAGGQRGTR